jgi:hypothetical protein
VQLRFTTSTSSSPEAAAISLPFKVMVVFGHWVNGVFSKRFAPSIPRFDDKKSEKVIRQTQQCRI